MIFISHQHEDKIFVDQIAHTLKDLYGKENVFYDDWSIKPGDNIIDEMSSGLEACKFFFYFITDKSLKSYMVQAEWTSAFIKKSKKNIQFIPIKADDVEVPAILSSLKYLDLYTNSLDIVTRQIIDIINGTETEKKYSDFNNLHAYALSESSEKIIFYIIAKKFFEPSGKFLLATKLNNDQASFVPDRSFHLTDFQKNTLTINDEIHNHFLINIPEGIKKGFKEALIFTLEPGSVLQGRITLIHAKSDKKLMVLPVTTINSIDELPDY